MVEPLAHVEVTSNADGVRCAIRGEVDLSNVGDVERSLRMAIGDAQHVTVDLAECRYLDSQGVRLLHMLASDLNAGGGGLAVVAPGDSFVHDVVRMTDLAAVAEVRTA